MTELSKPTPHFRTREVALVAALSAPNPPIEIVYADENSISAIDALIGMQKGVGKVQESFEAARLAAKLPQAKEPRVKAVVLYWEGECGLVVGYASDGAMVGFGQAAIRDTSQPITNGPNLYTTYNTEYIVSPQFEGRGIAGAMMATLENSIAANNTGIGAAFIYTVQAETPDRKSAAHKLISNAGAIADPNGTHFGRMLVKTPFLKHSSPGLYGLDERFAKNKIYYPKRRRT